MSKQEDKTKDKEETTAPGAGSSSETPNAANESAAKEETHASDAPAWVSELAESNKAVLESNQAVLDRIAEFNDNARTVVGDIMKEAKKAGSGVANDAQKNAPEVKVNKKAKYEVAEGKRFQISATGAIVEAGTDVSDLPVETLQSLLSQGIIKESE